MSRLTVVAAAGIFAAVAFVPSAQAVSHQAPRYVHSVAAPQPLTKAQQISVWALHDYLGQRTADTVHITFAIAAHHPLLQVRGGAQALTSNEAALSTYLLRGTWTSPAPVAQFRAALAVERVLLQSATDSTTLAGFTRAFSAWQSHSSASTTTLLAALQLPPA